MKPKHLLPHCKHTTAPQVMLGAETLAGNKC